MSEKNRPLQRSALETSTSERLAAIVEAAERAAAQVIDDAEAQARRYLADAQSEADGLVSERLADLAEQTDALIAQAEAIRDQSERLLDSLEGTRAKLGADLEGDREAGEPRRNGARGGHLTAVAPVDPGDGLGANSEGTAGARLLATQMAVSGNSREEIAARLRNGFEIEDTDAMLDAILGPED